ncbi:hypothetical protein ACQYWQ_10325 [Streptomyces sp. P6-2-1]|uniref:hypothetical protein n=1 Tax=unclassified Streptomyces TaxID=2593676 RepID=UPI003D363B2B
MEILWSLFGVLLIGAVVASVLRRRGATGIRLARPGDPDAADPAAYGFVRQEELDVRLPGPDDELLRTLRLVQGGQDWQAAARLLAGTDKHGELRWQRVQAFAGAASLELAARPGEGGRWLRTWRAEAPKDAGAAAVHAEFLVQQAWRTSTVGTDEFRIILEEARAACEQAALLAPGDPVPHITRLAVARGLGESHEDFERLWLKILDVAPAHLGAHLAALSYWSAKWHGSADLADSFAQAAAARAPRGSLLAALPLFSLFDHMDDVVLVQDFHSTAVVKRALHGALYAVQSAPHDDPATPLVRHLLLHFLVRGQRWSEAMEQIVRVDGYVGALPWTLSEDPAAEYAVYRALAVAGYEANGGNPATLAR